MALIVDITTGDLTTAIREHRELQLLGADDHSQYLHLAGRAGGQTAFGGTASMDTLTFWANPVDLASMVLRTFSGFDSFLTVGPGGTTVGGDAYVTANASSDPGAFPGFRLASNTAVKGIWQYRPDAATTDFIFTDDLLFSGDGGGGIVDFRQNGDVILQGDGGGGGLLWVDSSTGTNPAIAAGSAKEFTVDGNGNLVKLNNVTTSAPSANVLGYLHNDGAGTWVWQAIPGSDITGAALTRVDDTNVTLTLGGTPATALLRATSLTLGWTGTLAIARGGTGAGTALAAFNALSPLTTRGDLLTRDTTNNIRLAIGAANTVLGSNGTDPSWVAAGSTGGGLPTASANQTLRATGTNTWAASSVLTNDGTNLVDSGTLTVQGASITGGTAGTAFTATFGQGTTGTDNSGVVVRSGNGSNAESSLSIQRNTTVESKLYANQASLTLLDFRTTFQFRDAANSGSVVMTLVDVVGIVAATIGLGGTGTNGTTLTVNSGNSGTTAPTINLARNNTSVGSWTYDGTDTYFDYTGTLQVRTSVGGTIKFALDTNGKISEYRDETTAGNGVPSILANIALTGQSGNIAATNLVASTAAAGMYRATFHYCTTTTGNAVTITGSVNYTSDVTNTAVAFSGATIAINTANAKATATFTFQARSGTAITYQASQSGALGAGRYAFYCILERLS